MRKIYSFAVAAVAMFAAMSCAKEIVQDNQQAGMPDNDALTFVARVDGADDASETKSVLDGLKSYWDGEEKIWILDPRNETNDEGTFFNTSWKKIFTANAEKSETATFVEDDKNTSLEGESLMALYPAGPAGGAYWEGGESQVQGMWLTNEQTAVAGSYDPTAHIAIARASKSSNLLEFKNVSSLLKFQVAENIKGEVKFISYKPTAGEAPRISGNFSVDYNDGNPSVTPESGENKITFDAVALKGEFAVDNDYYMAILPANLEAGFAVQINGYTVKELAGESLQNEKFVNLLDRKRNMILNLGTVSLNFGVCGTHTDWESDTPMSYDEASGLYVAQDVTFDKENNAFKIRPNGLWTTSVGTGGVIAVDSRNQAYMNGGDSMIAAGTYDIWFDADRKIIYAMSDGNTPADLKFASMVYLKPAAGWSSDNAKFAAYFFGDAVEPIAIMIHDSDSDGIYEAAVPKGDYSQLLFVRLSSDTESFDWNRTLHQTFDLETPMSDNDKLCYVITTMPDNHKYSEGIWQTLEEAKGTPEEPEPVVHEWAIAGTFNGWNTSATPMVKEGNYYVARNVTGLNFTAQTDPNDQSSSTGFKFIVNGEWKGSEGEIAAGAWGYVWDKDAGSNIYVDGADASAAYDIYVNPSEGDNGKFVIVAAGDPMPEDKPAEEPEVTPGEASEWAIIGDFNGSGQWVEKQMLTTVTSKVFVIEDVVIPTDYFSILVKKYNDSDWTVKYGGGIVYFNPGNSMKVYTNGSDICITKAGTYDFYFDLANTMLYVVNPGVDYTTVSEQTVDGEEPKQEEPEVTSNVLYLTFSGVWQNGDERFAAYFFNNSGGNTWVSMKDSDSDGIYEVNIPEGYNLGDNVIFCRMKGTSTSNGWTNKWNQTADLTIPTDGKNLYTVKSWDNSPNTHWSTK